jgi:HEAT repeat protein
MSNFTDPLLISIETRLQDADPGIRRVAVMELVDSPEPEAVELLITALSDSEADVRMEAAKVIDEFEPIDMMDALVEALTAPDENVRNAAASALADLKDKSVAPALLEALKKDDVFVLSAVLRALKQLRIKDARSYAIELLQHAHPSVRREAVGVLGYLQDVENLPQLMSVVSNDADAEVRRAAVGTLIFAPAPMVSDTLMSAITDENWLVRVESIKGLGKLKVAESLGLLISAIDDERWQVQEKAAEAIGILGNQKGFLHSLSASKTRSVICVNHRLLPWVKLNMLMVSPSWKLLRMTMIQMCGNWPVGPVSVSQMLQKRRHR